MLFHCLATIAFLASGLFFDQLSAAEHGHFGKIARNPYRISDQMMERPKLKNRNQDKYRFLNSNTEG
jgi:hypothetical protein